MTRKNPDKYKFTQQKTRAKRRGVEWNLSFDEWMSIWMLSGKYSERGRGSGKYVMARFGDSGPYSVENVFICLFEENLKDAYRNKPQKCGGYLNLGKAGRHGEGAARGWSYIARAKKNPYHVSFKSKYVGCFPTQELAEAAYKDILKKFSADLTGNSTGNKG